jgi:ribosomal protein S6
MHWRVRKCDETGHGHKPQAVAEMMHWGLYPVSYKLKNVEHARYVLVDIYITGHGSVNLVSI